MQSWWRRPDAGLRIGGHRGAAAVAPENTLAAVRRAIDGGADYVEIDVHRSADDQLVVIHDDQIGRTTDGTGSVSLLTTDGLRALDAGAWFGPAFAGEPVPLLGAVLELLERAATAGRGPVGAVVEAKGGGTGSPLARALGASPLRDRLAVCSFDSDEIRAARATEPAIPAMLIVDRERPDDDPVQVALACGAELVNIPVAWLTRGVVDGLHARGLLVAGGTGDDEPTVRAAVELGLDAIDSNRPDLAVRWRDRARRPA